MQHAETGGASGTAPDAVSDVTPAQPAEQAPANALWTEKYRPGSAEEVFLRQVWSSHSSLRCAQGPVSHKAPSPFVKQLEVCLYFMKAARLSSALGPLNGDVRHACWPYRCAVMGGQQRSCAPGCRSGARDERARRGRLH